MKPGQSFDAFFSLYAAQVVHFSLLLREIIFEQLPGITEQTDMPAKMVAYGYGQKYGEIICTLIPSKKGIKLGFNDGVNLPDPEGILQGTGKISRYVEIKSEEQIQSDALKNLFREALKLYEKRMEEIRN